MNRSQAHPALLETHLTTPQFYLTVAKDLPSLTKAAGNVLIFRSQLLTKSVVLL